MATVTNANGCEDCCHLTVCEHNVILCRCSRARLEHEHLRVQLHHSAAHADCTQLPDPLVCSSRPQCDCQHSAACFSPGGSREEQQCVGSDRLRDVCRELRTSCRKRDEDLRESWPTHKLTNASAHLRSRRTFASLPRQSNRRPSPSPMRALASTSTA